MRNPIDVLNSLSDKSKNESYRFERLYRNLYNPKFYVLAYRNIYANAGSMTPGVDGTTMDGMSNKRIENLIESLKNRSYNPAPARRTYIEKKNSKKKRPLGIPSGDDKLVQEVIRMILESIYEPTFFEASHGFRPGKSCHTALLQLQRTFTGSKWFVEGDIKACFDSFDHHVLIGILRKRIDDEAFIALMWKFLKAGYMEQWVYEKTYSGTPQGSGMSPVLANIYLSELDRYAAEYKNEFDTGNPRNRKVNPKYKSLGHQIEQYQKKNAAKWADMGDEEKKRHANTLRLMKSERRKLQVRMPHDRAYKRLQYIRYADDFIIGVIGSKEDAERLKADLGIFLDQRLKLTLSDEKTHITHTTDSARFLGYDISVSRDQTSKRRADGVQARVYTGIVTLKVPHEKWESKLRQCGAIRIRKDSGGKDHIRAIHRAKLINHKDIDILSKYNAEVRGFYNYYSLAINASVIGQFSGLMKYSMLKTFASKYRTQVSVIQRRYVKNGNFTVAYETSKGRQEAVYYNKGFARKKEPMFGQIDMLDVHKRYDKPNSLAAKLWSKTCELCGAKSDDIEIHQIKLLKELTGKYEWERIMMRRRRKTLAVCPKCHNEIHESD